MGQKINLTNDGTISVASGSINSVTGTISLDNPTTTTCTINLYPQRTLVSSQVVRNGEENFIEMVYREVLGNFGTTASFTNYSLQEVMIKEVYGVKNGKLDLINTIKGREVPGYYVPASVIWEE